MTKKVHAIDKIEADYKAINYFDGITQEEVVIIAKYYIIKNKKSDLLCNVKLDKFEVADSSLNNNWYVIIFDANSKFKNETGLKWFSIHVDKSSGEIKVQGWGPS